jgi:pimeloyl-ACP methyl ester carboxylesterase
VPTPVRLQTHVWNPLGDRRALLLHGLTADGACWWRLASELAADGYLVVAPDLRSHGRSPATDDLTLEAFADDVQLLGDGYDLVVGHSLGGAVAAVLLASDGFAGAGLLLDPALRLSDDEHERAREQLRGQVGHLDLEELRRSRPTWHPRDVEHKVLAAAQVAPSVVDGTFEQNAPWDVLGLVARSPSRVHVVAADPDAGGIFPAAQLAELTAHPHVTGELVADVGHSIHRERPDVVRDAVRTLTAPSTPRPSTHQERALP